MKLQKFLAIVDGLGALPSAMKEHLSEMAPHMSDQQRSDTAMELRSTDKQLVKATKEAASIADSTIHTMDAFRRDVLAPMRRDEERSEQGFDATRAEQLFTGL